MRSPIIGGSLPNIATRDFGSFNNTLANGFTPKKKLLGIAVVNNSNPQLRENQVQAGFSYRFNLLPPPPVVVKY